MYTNRYITIIININNLYCIGYLLVIYFTLYYI